MAGDLGKTRSGASGGKPKKKAVKVSVPYAPTPKGKKAEREDRGHVTVPYAPTPTGRAAEKKAARKKATSKKAAKQRAEARAIAKIVGPQPRATERKPSADPYAYRPPSALEMEVDRKVTEPLGKAGYHKTTGQKIYEKVAEYGPYLIPEAGGIVKGLKTAGKAVVKDTAATTLPKDATRAARPRVAEAPSSENLLNKTFGKDARGARTARRESDKAAKRASRRIRPKAKARAKVRAKRKIADKKVRYGKEGRRVARRNREVKLRANAPFIASTGAGVGAAGVVGADIEGTLNANPTKAIPRTLEIAPGLIVSTADLGLQAIHAAVTGDTAGLRKRIAEEVASNKDMAKVFTSGDPEAVKKFTEEQGYIAPLIVAGPLAKLGREARAVRGKPPVSPDLSDVSAAERSFKRSRKRKQTARRASLENSYAQHQVTDAAKPVTKAYLKTKKRRKIRDKPSDRGDVVALAAEEGLTPRSTPQAIQRVLDKWDARPEVPRKREGGVTGHDLARLIRSDSKLFEDKNFWNAVDAYRAQAGDVTTSERVGNIEQLKTHGIQQEEHVLPPKAREVTNSIPEVSSRPQAEKFFGKDGPNQKNIARLSRTLRSAKSKARELRAELAQRERHQPEGKTTRTRQRQLLDVEADIAAMQRELGAARGRGKRVRAALRDPEQDRLVRAETQAKLKAVQGQEGLVPGVYVPHTDVTSEGLGVSSNVVNPSKKIHQRKVDGTSLAEQGKVDYSLPTLLQAGIAAPRITKGVHRFVSREMHTGAIKVPVVGRDGRVREKRIVTRREAQEGLTPEQKKHVVLFDVGKFNQAVREGDVEGMDEAVQGLGQEIDWAKETKGKKYAVLDKDHGKEIIAQVTAPSTGLRAAQTASRGISRAILASPAWQIAQIVAEGLQAAHVVNPLNPATYYHFGKGVKGYLDMSPAERRRVKAEVGETAIGYDKSFFTVKGETQRGLVSRFNRMERVLPLHRVLQAVKLDWLNAIDRYKGGKIQLGTTLIEAHREAYGLGKRIERTLKKEKALSQRLAKMSAKERLQWSLKDSPDKRSITAAIKDQLGDWRSLSRRERVAAPALIFYPFLRMSLQWPFYSLPKHHPIRASIMYDIASSHNQQIRELFGGPPSWFGEYATAIVYDEDAPGGAHTFKAQRIVPGANAILEAANAGFDSTTQRVLNPVVGFYNALINGIDPLSGEPIDTAGMSAEEKLIARAGLTTSLLLNINPELRAADQAMGSKENTSLPIIGKRREKGALGDLLEELNGTPKERALTTLFNPFPGEDADHAKDSATMGRIFGVWRQFGSDAQEKAKNDSSLPEKQVRKKLKYMESRMDEADNELHHLYQKYDVDYKAEEKKSLDRWTRLTYPQELSAEDKLNKKLGLPPVPSKEDLDKQLGIPSTPSVAELDKQLGIR